MIESLTSLRMIFNVALLHFITSAPFKALSRDNLMSTPDYSNGTDIRGDMYFLVLDVTFQNFFGAHDYPL